MRMRCEGWSSSVLLSHADLTTLCKYLEELAEWIRSANAEIIWQTQSERSKVIQFFKLMKSEVSGGYPRMI